MAELELKTYGQIAYEAYFNSTGGKSLISGQNLPRWSEQFQEIRAAWEAAARAVAWEIRREKKLPI